VFAKKGCLQHFNHIKIRMKTRLQLTLILALIATWTFTSLMGDSRHALPDPDGKPADMNKPVKVYILMGQSNMLGFGRIEPGRKGPEGSLVHAVKEKGLYPYLVDDQGSWTVRKDVRNVRVMGSGTGGMRVFVNDWMTIGRSNIGPEIGIGHHLGQVVDEPVLILKSCIGNRALGWDLLPPGSEGYEFTDSKGVTWVHPGYKGTPERWKKGRNPRKLHGTRACNTMETLPEPRRF
jgi:hypothetical protein